MVIALYVYPVYVSSINQSVMLLIPLSIAHRYKQFFKTQARKYSSWR